MPSVVPPPAKGNRPQTRRGKLTDVLACVSGASSRCICAKRTTWILTQSDTNVRGGYRTAASDRTWRLQYGMLCALVCADCSLLGHYTRCCRDEHT